MTTSIFDDETEHNYYLELPSSKVMYLQCRMFNYAKNIEDTYNNHPNTFWNNLDYTCNTNPLGDVYHENEWNSTASALFNSKFPEYAVSYDGSQCVCQRGNGYTVIKDELWVEAWGDGTLIV